MQKLVYDNYNKFITATETIRVMKADVYGMDPDMEAVRYLYFSSFFLILHCLFCLLLLLYVDKIIYILLYTVKCICMKFFTVCLFVNLTFVSLCI